MTEKERGGTVSTHGDRINAYKILIKNPEGKISHERLNSRR